MNALDQQAEDQEIDQLLALADERVAFPDGAESTVDKLRSELETIAVDLREPVSSEPFEAEPACLRAVEMAAALMQKPVSVLVSVPAQGQDRAPQVVDASLNGLGEIGPYKLLELLGQGGMGAVYKALHPRLEKIVALKVLRAARIKSDALDRFDREMKALGKLDHPHLIRALDAGEADVTHYLVMEFVSGMDLSALLAMRGKLRVADSCELIAQAAAGLHAAHSRGMIHRDIKPANLMLAEQEFGPPIVKVLDLGLALLSESPQPDAGGLTSDGQIMGTIDYMPPEQAQDSHTVDERADIYSLGATLYALLTGGSVFQGRPLTTLMQKLMALATEPVPPIRERRPDMSEPLAQIVHRMLARDPKQRFASMAEVIAALKPFAVGANLSALIAGESDQTVVLQADLQSNAFGEPGGVSPRTLAETVVVKPIVRGLTPPGSPSRSGVGTNRRTAIAAAVAGVLLLGAILFSIKTPNGEIIVNVDGLSAEEQKQIEIKVTGNGVMKIANEANGWTIGVKEGKYSVELTGSSDQMEVKKNEVTVTRRDKAIVTVSLKPNDVAMSAKTPNGTNPANAPAPAIAPFDAAQARKHQEAWAKHLGVPVEYTNSIGMKFVLIPPGEFEMGSTAAEIEAALKYLGPADPLWKSYVQMEAPKHKVILTQARYLGVNEVTQSEYERVMGKNPSNFAATGLGKELVAGIVTAHHPVEMVSWLDVVDFCAKLSEQERLKPFAVRSGDVDVITPENGNGYKVPTEAEWEFACRAGTTTKYWFGDNDEDLMRAGWVGANSGGRTHAVGGLKANPFGLFDVHGNVMEYVRDTIEQISYEEFRNRPAINPSSLPILGQRVCRGGPLGAPWECRSASRSVSDYAPDVRAHSIGFRVSLPVDAVKAAVINKTLQDERMSNDPDYQFALWLKSLTPPLQFVVTLADGNGRPQTIEPTQLLPLEPFRVNYLFLQGPVLDQPGEAFVDEFATRVKGQRITGIQFNSPTLTSERVARFAKLPELSDVNTVAITGELVDDKVIEALAGLHKLIHADLRCPKLTGKGLRQLSELTGLSLHDAANVTAEGIEELAQLPKFYSLMIDGYFHKVQLTERHIDAVTKLKLTEFLTDAVGIDDALLTRLSKMETLQVLVLNKSPITDTGLAELKKLKGLTNLSLVGTKVTAAGVVDLQQALPNCKIEWDAPKE